jgi:uncharacterized protein (DUF1697 family)
LPVAARPGKLNGGGEAAGRMHETYVALLRGINVGRAKRIAMADLRRVVVDLGYSRVRTLLASGNVILEGPAAPPEEVARRIEEGVESAIGIFSRVTALTRGEFEDVCAGNALAGHATNPSRLMVGFLQRHADMALLSDVAATDWAPEELVVGGRAYYAWCPEGLLSSPLTEALAKPLGDQVTVRNWATVGKVRGLLEAG